jgi:para-nitrobenzyl esterase
VRSLLLLSAVLVMAGPSQDVATTRAMVSGGEIVGRLENGVVAFKGIPYAAPPVGALRWRAPQPVPPWQGVRHTTDYGSDCMQKPFAEDAAPLRTTPAEDCLYLNVWRPAREGPLRPVIVWLYGGAFVNGGSSPAVYDGSAFARDDVVSVSFNYRLGRFGFFAHPALTAENADRGLLGNYGFMDQIAALAWVRGNIAAFGGDPRNVTLVGESAGGAAVYALLTSPLAKGLFQKAIVQSRGLMPLRSLRDSRPDRPSGEAVGVAFAQDHGIAGRDAAALAALRALPAAALSDDLNYMTLVRGAVQNYVGGPLIDGRLVAESPDAVLKAARQARVPLIIGATSGDNVAMMVEPARFAARELAAQGLKVFRYRFGYVAESMRGEWKEAPHASDIPFAFDTVAARYGEALTANDRSAARSIHGYWVAFARDGDPGDGGGPRRPAYDRDREMILDFRNAGPAVVADPMREELDAVTAERRR